MTTDQQAAPVKHRKRRIWLAAIVATVLVLGVLFWLRREPPMPTFEGKSLAYWFHQLPVAVVPSSTNWASGSELAVIPSRMVVGFQVHRPTKEKPDDAVRAIRSMGTNAVPFLISKIQSRKSSFRNGLQLWAIKLGIKARFVDSPEVERGRAVTGLIYLDHLPENAKDELRRLGAHSDPVVAASASIVFLPFSQEFGITAGFPTNTTTIFVNPTRVYKPLSSFLHGTTLTNRTRQTK